MPSRMSRTTSRPDRPAPFGQVDLGHVAGDDDLRAEPEPGQEHLHLLGRRVLRFVEDDERVVQGAAAHVRKRRDLDRAPVHQAVPRLGVEHVVERVVERAQIRVDLGEDVAGQEAEPLSRLDRRAGEDDAVDLLRLERLHRQRDGEVALARTGGADGERDRVVADCVDVPLLARGLRPHASCGRAGPRSSNTSVGRWSALSISMLRPTPSRSRLWPCSSSITSLLEQAADALGFGGVAGDGDLVAPHVDLDGEGVLDQSQELVALPEQAHHEVVARNENLDLSRGRRGHVGAMVAPASAPSPSR